MAVEIKEIVVRAIVPNNSSVKEGSSCTADSPAKEQNKGAAQSPSTSDCPDLIQKCVDQVLHILEKKKLR